MRDHEQNDHNTRGKDRLLGGRRMEFLG